MSLTTDVHADAPCDSHDLLAEIRNNFLAEGLDQCSRILMDLKSGPRCAIEVIQRVLHRWAGLAGTLGFPEISDQARKIEPLLLTSTSPAYHEIERAIEIARRKFSNAARNRPKLPLELITGLMGVRIGLVSFSEEEAKRLRTTAHRDNVQVAIEQLKSESIEKQTGYSALVINECAISAQTLHRPKLSIPVVFIRSRSSLESLSKLPAHAYDFLIAPWDAEEVLIRVYRLVAKIAPSQPAAGSLDTKNGWPRVLIVDDDPDLVAIVSATLRQFEMDCDIATNGEQALDAVHRFPPDAIILDVNMFDLDGFEVLKRLRRNLITKEIPVLLLTARGQESDIARGFGSGADDYVVKPFKPLDLVKRVDSMISARRKPWLPR
jgi:CheY-like chemotaxis protein/HPt (histidine-containing phosphotransfer) domain-containing protein